MPIFEIGKDGLSPIDAATFEALGLKERKDIQRLLKARIEALDEGLLVLAEEFGEWLDSSRRIDLLCLDTDANLVVVELKRTEDGGHMELQALRYAAMVSTLTFDHAVEALARERNKVTPDLDAARAEILAFLGWTEPDEEAFAQDTRIILAAGDFGKELTTAVMWLRRRNINISCVRLRPYRMASNQVLLDAQKIIPLPEAAQYQTQLGVKILAQQKDRAEGQDLRYQFWTQLLDRAKQKTPLHANRAPSDIGYMWASMGRAGFSLNYIALKQDARVEFYIEYNKLAFHALLAEKDAIEKELGFALDWQELPKAMASRICVAFKGGYRSPPEAWPDLQDELITTMIAFDKVFRPRIPLLP